ncbi:unnamed protein product [Lactuca saligna]|uniref:Uncharacterized protein n=1 Tax=Lactuca saligna TaxID=75948 RepID=A0AA36A1I9_LACSI|nr:unnamed protein product [Lactuca saligna]
MASEITEEDDNEDSYFLHNRDAQKEKIRQLIKHQKNHYQSTSSSSSSSSTSTGAASRSSCSSFDQNQSRKLLNLMKKGSTSLRRLFDMEHTSLANHFDYYCCSPETKTIPLWGSDSDDAIHDDPWMGITKISSRFIQQNQELEKHQEHDKKHQEHDKEYKEYQLGNQKLTRKKSFSKFSRFYKFRFRFPFRFRLKPRLRFCSRIWRGKKKA